MPPIERIIVLMLENRSFDHVFGFSKISGVEAGSGAPTAIWGLDGIKDGNPDADKGHFILPSSPAEISLKGIDPDPGHEFGDVLIQLSGLSNPTYPDLTTNGYPLINNQGFIESYKKAKANMPDRIMHCFSEEQLPVLNTLAKEFAICDNWFSSMPGPTWPNRFFVMAGSSGGLQESPSTGDIIKATALQGYSFEHGNIFDALDAVKIPWTIFEGDDFPLSFALRGMNHNASIGRFENFSNFESRLNDPSFSSKFIFIEPKYGKHTFDLTGPGDFSGGNSMHPLDDIIQGEILVKNVYETIRNSALWEKSILLVVFDEHGGFYDHQPPPTAIPPGDDFRNANNSSETPFKFDQLGPRVPALVISPWIAKGTIDHHLYDHTSALATLERLFGIAPLTQRDSKAADLLHLCALESPRKNTLVKLPEPFEMPEAPSLSVIPAQRESKESLLRDLERLKTPLPLISRPLKDPETNHSQIGFTYVALLKVLNQSDLPTAELWKQEFKEIETNRDAARFMTKAKLMLYYGIDMQVSIGKVEN